MGEVIKVGMADLKTCLVPNTITTLGLGSCVGVAIRDTQNKVGGLAHVMLPDSTAIRNNDNIAKFADTGIKELISRLEKEGLSKSSLVAKIAGGAQMFAFNTNNNMLQVGMRNAEAARTILRGLGIRVLAEDTGENYGRTVIFYPETGDFVIRAVGKPERTI